MDKYNKERLIVAVNNSQSFAGVLRQLNLRHNGGTQTHIKKKIIKYGIDFSHFTGQGHNKGKPALSRKTWQEILRNRPDKDRREDCYRLRRALMESGREYKCEECGIGDEYNGKKITLDIDHIDGNWTNHVKENLRFLCPNCHSQTSNFGSKNKKTEYYTSKNKLPRKSRANPNRQPRQKIRRKHFCSDCKIEIKSNAPRCIGCNLKKRRVTTRPNKEELNQIIHLLPFTEVAKIYNVSDNAIRKWCKYYNLDIPKLPTGFWLRNMGD